MTPVLCPFSGVLRGVNIKKAMFFNRSGGSRLDLPPVTKNIIIVNVLVWVVEIIFPHFADSAILPRLGLHYVDTPQFNPAQIITYMFVHDPSNPMHILFNMFTLWMFGRVLERVWGARRFLMYYFLCGMGAALIQEGVWALTLPPEYLYGMAGFRSHLLTIGASGAIFGLLLGFAFVFPNMPLYLFFIPVPIKAKYMVLGYGVLEFFLGIGGAQSTVAHFAHLGGMLFGLIPLLIWKKKGTLRGGKFY